MRKILATTTIFAVAALMTAAVALAVTPKANQLYAGNTAHGHYRVSIITNCVGKKCTTATTTTITLRAGSPTKPVSGCPSGGYDLPAGKIKRGKFSASTEFVVAGKILKFTVSGTFTAKTKLKGTVTGPSACGGSDAFSFTGHHVNQVPTIGPTGSKGPKAG